MPIARFQLPDGRIARFEVAEGTTPEEASDAFDYWYEGVNKATKEAASPKDSRPLTISDKASVMFLRGALPRQLVDFTVGASGLSRSGANTVGGLFGYGKLGEKLFPTSAAGDSTARTVGEFLDPLAFAIGGGAFKAASMLPKAGGVVKSIVGGAGAGAGIGGLSEDGSVAGGTATGALLGLALPFAIASGRFIGKTVGEVADLIIPGGAENISLKYINTIIGENNRNEIISALRSAKEIVRGSKPTVAEAVDRLPGGSPLQAHQKLVAQTPGGVSEQFGSRLAEQQAARDAQLSFAGTEEQLKALIADRSASVRPLYDAVKTSRARVSAIPVFMRVNEILKENVNKDSVSVPLKKIKDALIVGTPRGQVIETNPQKLKSLSDNISDMMGKKAVGGGQEFDVSVLREIKEILDGQIGIAEPAYKNALTLFAEKSVPIDQMKIGQALKAKLTSPLGVETPSKYVSAIENEKKLLKESLGFGRVGIEKKLTPEQLSAIESVTQDLERKVSSANPLQKTDLRGGVNMAHDTTFTLPQLLSRPALVANYIIKSLGRNAEPEIDAYLAKLYLNPKMLGDLLAKTPPAQRAQLNSIVQSYGKAVAINYIQQEH